MNSQIASLDNNKSNLIFGFIYIYIYIYVYIYIYIYMNKRDRYIDR